MTAIDKEAQKRFIGQVLAETGLSIEALANRLEREPKTIQRMKWGDIRLTERNRAELQKLRQEHSKGRPVFGLRYESRYPAESEDSRLNPVTRIKEEPDASSPHAPEDENGPGLHRSVVEATRYMRSEQIAEWLAGTMRDQSIPESERKAQARALALILASKLSEEIEHLRQNRHRNGMP